MSRIFNAQMHAWLQVFACAARHLSFTRCAEELHVTPGAISQQMRQLEERLGFALFHRVGRGLELTAEGQRLAVVANEVQSRISEELRLLYSGRIGGVFKLRCIPSFLSKWLMPRLPRLQEAFPDIQLRIIAEDSSGSLRDDDFDLAIDLNDGSYPGLSTTPLLEEELFPVCSPSLLVGKPPLDTPSQLVHFPLLHDITAWRGSYEYAEWEFYLTAIGADGIDVRRGHTFNRNHLTIDAARMGMGVAIARKALITDELEQGLLIVPFGHPIKARKKYVLAYREGALSTPARRAVHDWLVGEAAH
ncbi:MULTISPECIES: LysR substrate-binding domain-containing protein [Pseudomonas syringae group]|uniref:LysR family transcriptional regulator n=19 Tax=Pseudomonas syringae group TaxID=136849 RepID=A0AAD0E3B9_9PSED|nr:MULTISPECIES: LysR substrate-binding domain-containing protein [Pseudomonas syringae group]AVB21283.1 LysR family transcriptional regulator [Pseudomonas avellanae]EGH13344.1 LysR family transcriptional regulator [Pseudomonas amygdali pv. morsprunorum str. M302280]EPM48673.1 LysR family transcriptional regulator [Pseudomonas syringae pv. actinidiae ICMP 19098]EPN19371.1 LysR family transcriptional regulator [Pseudomonas syringae pv. actinidiae ICMP 19100]EPN27283.1 LysR family transcriptiona